MQFGQIRLLDLKVEQANRLAAVSEGQNKQLVRRYLPVFGSRTIGPSP